MKVSEETLRAMAEAIVAVAKRFGQPHWEYLLAHARAAADAIPEGGVSEAARKTVEAQQKEVDWYRAESGRLHHALAETEAEKRELADQLRLKQASNVARDSDIRRYSADLAAANESIDALTKENERLSTLPTARATPAPPSEEAVEEMAKAAAFAWYRNTSPRAWNDFSDDQKRDWREVVRAAISTMPATAPPPTPQPASIDDATVERLAEAAHKAWHGPKSSAVSWGETHRSLRVDWLNVSRAILAALPATPAAPSELHEAIDLAAELSKERGVDVVAIRILSSLFRFTVYARGCAPVEREGKSLLSIVKSLAADYRAALAPPPPPDPVMRVLEEEIRTARDMLYIAGNWFCLNGTTIDANFLDRTRASLAQKINAAKDEEARNE